METFDAGFYGTGRYEVRCDAARSILWPNRIEESAYCLDAPMYMPAGSVEGCDVLLRVMSAHCRDR